MAIFSINFFTYDAETKTYIGEASDLKLPAGAADVFPMQIASADREIETFKVSHIYTQEDVESGEKEIVGWSLSNEAGDRTIMLYND
jgi:hypothetical protein